MYTEMLMEILKYWWNLIWPIAFALFGGCLIGLIIGFCAWKKMTPNAGIFHIDRRDPMKDICKMELSMDLDDFLNNEKVIFIVDKVE